MYYFGLRLINGFAADFFDSQAQVCFFVITGRKQCVKAAEVVPERFSDHQARSAAIIYLFKLVEFRSKRVFENPYGGSAAVFFYY